MRTCSTTISACLRLARLSAASRPIKRVLRADRYENVAGLHADVLRRQVGFLRQIELIEFDSALPAQSLCFLDPFLGNLKRRKEQSGKDDSRHRRSRLREKVDHCDPEQRQRDQSQAQVVSRLRRYEN